MHFGVIINLKIQMREKEEKEGERERLTDKS